ncbi:serine/threonine protein kinase [Euhalothece natronophila Z-M001]|uniref:non-specific serine/threonine protein kinase n=1 Tax=Euhalothece natronophila Z-M001 TaxID=522448 RepID=A0A5B8NIF6_9CHRO|nr:serine/threonine-protein kinase [Euhalothece natronophila]QDZ38727.1 serine/threonine protein kinase [Euhalothece natronophila Z-M001]
MKHQIGDIIGDRFRITEKLGEGNVTTTFAAIDEAQDQTVAIKSLSFSDVKDWKTLELFEREAKTLKQLDHPQIPNYVDYLQIDTPNGDRELCIVQELAEGKSLHQLKCEGWQPSEAEVKSIAEEVLNVLSYIHNLKPPIIHRDIKPHNIIRQKNGKIVLVDFDAIQDRLLGGTTIVGTYGYMAPEQYQGRAQPTSDLYGLGATVLYLLTGKDTAQFFQEKSKIDVSSEISLSPTFANWLEGMLEPAIKNRFNNAQDALEAMQASYEVARPFNSDITLKRTKNSLDIVIPPTGITLLNLMKIGMVILISFVSFPFVVKAILIAIDGAVILALLILFFPGLFFLNGIHFVAQRINWHFRKIILSFNHNNFILQEEWRILGFKYTKYQEGKTSNLKYIKNTEEYYFNYNNNIIKNNSLMLNNGMQVFYLATCRSYLERKWLKEQINDFISNIN